ncbi:hypothetical protein [Sphingomonas sp.]|jgi:hypothetical protein|uniref:hypothetical protein n=1 Tax=Sphingomonas sp. TaxID=28214 RepID=UPI002E2FE133|nr:hypothetical protein [Sphingomonas sp.]HEX4694041.1 hypothetical protein [Sphingomonas sp.]
MIRGLILLAAIGGIAAAARGQMTGSIRRDTAPIDVPDGRSTGDAARAISDNFALCIVKRHYPQVLKTLAGPQDAMHDYKFLPKLMDAECFTGSASVGRSYGTSDVELNTNPVSFRGALYKALVRKDFSRRPGTMGAAPLEITGDNAPIHRFADCVVRADPADTLKLVLATAGTDAEPAAIGALRPHLEQCTPTGEQMAFSKGNLIGYLAEAYFREADASKSTGAN